MLGLAGGALFEFGAAGEVEEGAFWVVVDDEFAVSGEGFGFACGDEDAVATFFELEFEFEFEFGSVTQGAVEDFFLIDEDVDIAQGDVVADISLEGEGWLVDPQGFL